MRNEINHLVSFDRFVLDKKKRILWCDDEIVDLPLKATDLLCVLIERNGEVVSKDTLLDQVWEASFVEEGVLPQNVYRLRQAFKKCGAHEDLIQTIPRRGYRFAGNVEKLVEEEISIERETFQRDVFAQASSEIDERPFASVVRTDRLSVLSGTNKVFAVAAVGVVVLFATASIWIWRSTDAESQSHRVIADKIKFSRITDSGHADFPAMSRDDQNIAYVLSRNNTSSIILHHVPTGSETVVVEPLPFEIRSLNFSADGYYLYYATRDPEGPESTIYQVPIYGGTRRKIMTNVRHYFSLSPSGKSFAFYRYEPEKNEYHLMTSDTEGANERIVATRRPPDFYRDWNTFPAWSPDEKKFVVSAHTNKTGNEGSGSRSFFLEIDALTGEEKVLNQPSWESAFQAFWLQDGNGFIVSARESVGDYAQLWHLSYPDGKATRITNDTNHYLEFRPSFDGGSLLTSKVATGSNLFTVSADDPADVRQLTDQSVGEYGRQGLTWSADGRSLIFVKTKGRSDANLWTLNVDTLEEQQLTFDEEFANVNPETMPDGRSVLFQSNRTGKWHLWQIGLDGTDLRQVTNGPDGEMRPDISGDGNWILYHTPGEGPNELRKMPLTGGESIAVLQNAAGVSKSSPSDPDQVIAYFYDPTVKSETPWKYILFRQSYKKLSRDLKIETENHAFSWDRGGTGIFFPRKQMNLNNLWFYSLQDNSLRQVTNFTSQKIVNLSISPDGKNIALSRASRTSNIFSITNFRDD